jgi:hypothetical protein
MVIMVNGHVGPKGNRLKAVWTITCLKSGYMARKKRIGQTFEVVHRLTGMKVETRV